MASRNDYTVGWICALHLELAAAKATLDQIHPNLPADPAANDTDAYVLGSISGHNVVVACLSSGETGPVSASIMAAQMRVDFSAIRWMLTVGIAGGVPSTKADIRLGDIVVHRPTADSPSSLTHNAKKGPTNDQQLTITTLNKPSNLLLTATGRVETTAILGKSQIPRHISDIVQKDSSFARPDSTQDILFQPDYDYVKGEDDCDHCDLGRVVVRQPRDTQNPKVHYGLIASSNQDVRDGSIRDNLAAKHGILAFGAEAAEFEDADTVVVIRGICDYADSHKSKIWQGCAAAAAAAYAKEMLSLISAASRKISPATAIDSSVAVILDALLLTRPDVDRSSLIALKGRRVEGTCDWIVRHPRYRQWLEGDEAPLLRILGGPGKGKTMLAIFLTEELQPIVDSTNDILLYYFCAKRDMRRKSAITILRGVLYQWLSLQPNLADHIHHYFDGSEKTKYTVSSFESLWELLLIFLNQMGPCNIVCVLDGLDECEEESLKQLLDALDNHFLESDKGPKALLKVILVSRPQPEFIETKLHRFPRIALEDSNVEVGQDVEKYIFAKVAELASEQSLSEDKLLQIRQTMMANAEGTFLWVGFVADELKGRSWRKISDILHGVPKGLGGIYRRLLHRIQDKDKLLPILQWVVLASRPLTVHELAMAVELQDSDIPMSAEVVKDRLAACGSMVKIDDDVVNLVHESARDFFQSDQVKSEDIDVFYMDFNTHRTLLRTCLNIIEKNYKGSGSISDATRHNKLLTYASLHWPDHFRYIFNSPEARSELSRQFFRRETQVREDWWRFYWEREQYGGAPPKFTLLHLAAFLGNLEWAKILLKRHSDDDMSFHRPVSQVDSNGRTPLFWAAARGHREVTELLLDHGARINARDRNQLSALHIAITGVHKEVVSLLLDRSARVEGKDNNGDTPLNRAVQVGAKDIVKLLLEHGARIDRLPGTITLSESQTSVEERTRELLQLQDQLLAARFKDQSKLVTLMLKIWTASLHVSPVFHLVSSYFRHWTNKRRWFVLQDLVKNNETTKLRKWTQTFMVLGNQLARDRNAKNVETVLGLTVRVFNEVSIPSLSALLIMGILVGSTFLLSTVQHGRWREGMDIISRIYAEWCVIAFRKNTTEALDSGLRQYLADLDTCMRGKKEEETVDRLEVWFNSLYGILCTRQQPIIEYIFALTTEYFEGHIGGVWEEVTFRDASQAFAYELDFINERQDSSRLSSYLSMFFKMANKSASKENRDWLFDLPPASCLILCQNNDNPSTYRWLICEGLPETWSNLIFQEQGPAQRPAFKAFAGCLIVGKQHGLSLTAASRKMVKSNLDSIEGLDGMLDQIS
ncbi:MAG: hypothetical protein Q9161_009580 [Pseudevernia consocians]